MIEGAWRGGERAAHGDAHELVRQPYDIQVTSRLTFERAYHSTLAADPAAEILIAYEMKGGPLRPDHASA